MSSPPSFDTRIALPRPSRPMLVVLVGLLSIWIVFAAGINWGGASTTAFDALCGNTEAIARGQVWRLLTAPLLHRPDSGAGVQHIAFALMGLYFLGTALEQFWGSARLMRFLAVTAVSSYALQWLVAITLPAALEARFVPGTWYGTTPVIAALSIAFASSLKNQKILLFFVVPLGSRALILATVGIGLLLLIADALGPAGHVAPFAGMLMGWTFGGGTPSPARKLWLRFRMGRLDAEVRRSKSRGQGGLKSRRFEVISGGLDDPKAKSRNDRFLH
jgi:membrane associated rhomboid family serine protease